MAQSIIDPDYKDVNIPNPFEPRPTTKPEPAKGLGIALTAAGKGIADAADIFREGTKLDDYTQKQSIENEEVARLEPLRRDIIRQNEFQLSKLMGQGNPDLDQSLIDADATKTVPDDVQTV